MNANKCAEELQRIFHLETLTGEDGNYELSSNYWGLKFYVRVRQFTIFIQSGYSTSYFGAKCAIDSDEDETTIAREIVAFIGEVLKDVSKTFTYDGTSGILAWPYNCNLQYVDYLKEAMDMGENETGWDYKKRKLEEQKGLSQSKKPIKSSLDVLYDYMNNGVFWDDVEAYAEELIRSGEITEEEYNRGKDELRKYFDNEVEKAQKTAWEREGKERGWTNSSRKPIKSYRDTSSESNPYGFYIDNETIYDKFGNFWTMCDYFTAPPDMIVMPYEDFDSAEKDMRYHIEDSYLEDEIGGDFDDYCYEFTKFAEKNVPYYIIDPNDPRFEDVYVEYAEVPRYDGWRSGREKKGINNSKKPIKSGMTYQQALDGFTANGKPWGDYWEMQQDWTIYVDNLTRDGEVDYEEARWWDNPCTPKEFNEWAGRTSDDTYDENYDDGVWDEDDEERLRGQYADEHGLDLNEDIIDEDDYNEWVHKGAAMYSSKTRNQSSLNKIFN